MKDFYYDLYDSFLRNNRIVFADPGEWCWQWIWVGGGEGVLWSVSKEEREFLDKYGIIK